MADKVSPQQYLQSKDIRPLIEEAVNACFEAHAENPVEFLKTFFANKLPSQVLISRVEGREVLDSRGNPTVEVDLYVKRDGKDVLVGRSSAPSGASTGSNEARELRDGDASRFLGRGVLGAVKNVSEGLSKVLIGADITKLREFDDLMRAADGTELKEKLGGNALTAASFSAAEAGASLKGIELFQHFATLFNNTSQKFHLPRPLVNILNGGKHAGGKLKIQEFMILPDAKLSFREGLRQVTEIYHHLGKILVNKYGPSAKNLGDEGGYAPLLDTPDQALKAIEEAIEKAGYKAGPDDVGLALDCASSEFYDADKKKYEAISGKFFTSEELVEFYEKLVTEHPALISIEDPMDEKDYEGWIKFNARFSSRINVVGDDLYTTNVNLIKQGIEKKWANTLLLKVNQIGTISEAMDAARLIFDAGQRVIVSHRSGESAGSLISDLAVGIGAGYIKTGATARGERIAKYNRLLQIEDYLREHNLLA